MENVCRGEINLKKTNIFVSRPFDNGRLRGKQDGIIYDHLHTSKPMIYEVS